MFYHQAYLERIFICIGLVAIVLGSIITIWTQFDAEFKDLHKPMPYENKYEMSSVPSTLLRTDATSSFNKTSNRHEGSLAKNK